MNQRLSPQFNEFFKQVLPGSTQNDFLFDAASELELEHYTYLYGSEMKSGSRNLEGLAKEPFAYLWINRPAQYLKSALDESKVK